MRRRRCRPAADGSSRGAARATHREARARGVPDPREARSRRALRSALRLDPLAARARTPASARSHPRPGATHRDQRRRSLERRAARARGRPRVAAPLRSGLYAVRGRSRGAPERDRPALRIPGAVARRAALRTALAAAAAHDRHPPDGPPQTRAAPRAARDRREDGALLPVRHRPAQPARLELRRAPAAPRRSGAAHAFLRRRRRELGPPRYDRWPGGVRTALRGGRGGRRDPDRPRAAHVDVPGTVLARRRAADRGG